MSSKLSIKLNGFSCCPWLLLLQGVAWTHSTAAASTTAGVVATLNAVRVAVIAALRHQWLLLRLLRQMMVLIVRCCWRWSTLPATHKTTILQCSNYSSRHVSGTTFAVICTLPRREPVRYCFWSPVFVTLFVGLLAMLQRRGYSQSTAVMNLSEQTGNGSRTRHYIR